jgi:hypothetical protein
MAQAETQALTFKPFGEIFAFCLRNPSQVINSPLLTHCMKFLPLTKNILTLCTLLFLLANRAGWAQTNAFTPPAVPAPAPAGSVSLWNGHDLTGWTPFFKGGIPAPPDFWSADTDNGVLKFTGKPTGYIRTNQSYSNYYLHVEWRWPGEPDKGINNSGVFVDQRPPDVVWPYSVQINTKVGSTGDLLAQGGLLFSADPTQLTLKKQAAANEKPTGEWNSFDIFCRGASIEVYVNGIRQNYVDKLPADSGQIALQIEGYAVEYRNIWLQQL